MTVEKKKTELAELGITPEQLKEADEQAEFIECATAHAPDGKQFWYYLSIKPSKYAEYKQRHRDGGKLNPKEFGEVLACGWGANPPDDIRAEMKEEFGCDPSFEKNLKTAIEKELRNNSQ